MSQTNQLSRNDAIELVAAELTEPISMKEFTTRVLDIWHSKAKDPHAGVRQAMRGFDHRGQTVLFLDDKTVTSMRLGMAGVQWRVPLSAEEASKGILYIASNFAGLKSRRLDNEALQLVDASDHTIPTKIVERQKTVKTIFGDSTRTLAALRLGRWYKKHKVNRKDYLLITILDWSAGKYRLEAEQHTAHRKIKEEVEKSNQMLMDELFQVLEQSRSERVVGEVGITAAYARLKEKLSVPADHWLPLMEADGRMRWNGYMISYADELSSLEQLFGDNPSQQPAAPAKLTAVQLAQVYQFKAYLKHNKRLWRRIEIQGGQDLQTLDDIMRDAFLFDTMDHLSGFWQRIRRGNTRRFREVDLATIYPFGGDSKGNDTPVAAIGLEPEDQLKYVYDFGDWIECRIELEEIKEAEEEADYPRIVAQNKPKYKYCPVCKAEGKKTIATYICLWCSSEKQQEVLMCEEHISPEHEDHYIEEMLY